MKTPSRLILILIAPLILLSYNVTSSAEHFSSPKYAPYGYVKLVNNTDNYVTVTLFVDGDGCGSAPKGDSCVCPVTAGVSHALRALGVDGAGKTDSASRNATVAEGDTFTWTIGENK